VDGAAEGVGFLDPLRDDNGRLSEEELDPVDWQKSRLLRAMSAASCSAWVATKRIMRSRRSAAVALPRSWRPSCWLSWCSKKGVAARMEIKPSAKSSLGGQALAVSKAASKSTGSG
jgi:hypothetical protein